MPTYPDHIQEKAKRIRLLICDVDGVLTNGLISYDTQGQEIKSFHAQDGLGLKLLQQNGVDVAIITARQSTIVAKRMQELGIKHCYQGIANKHQCLTDLAEELQLNHDAIAYLGDDLPDLCAMQTAGLSLAVANATNLVKQHADWITRQSGGHGAAREVAELILSCQQTLDTIHETFLSQ